MGLNETQNIIKVTVDLIKNFVSQIDDDQDLMEIQIQRSIPHDNEGSFRDLVFASPDEVDLSKKQLAMTFIKVQMEKHILSL